MKTLGAKKWWSKITQKATGYIAEDIKKMGAPMLSKKMVGYTQNIPGTRASKTRLRKIILAMVRQLEIETHRVPDNLGDMPCLFGTLTSQRYHWDEVIRIIAAHDESSPPSPYGRDSVPFAKGFHSLSGRP